jgi:hypothetical protein
VGLAVTRPAPAVPGQALVEVTATSGRRYRVLRGGVVRLHPRGSGYCIEATSPVPVADEMLANKLLSETDERRFLATAHRFPYR